jgi:hypothetical protein
MSPGVRIKSNRHLNQVQHDDDSTKLVVASVAKQSNTGRWIASLRSQ